MSFPCPTFALGAASTMTPYWVMYVAKMRRQTGERHLLQEAHGRDPALPALLLARTEGEEGLCLRPSRPPSVIPASSQLQAAPSRTPVGGSRAGPPCSTASARVPRSGVLMRAWGLALAPRGRGRSSRSHSQARAIDAHHVRRVGAAQTTSYVHDRQGRRMRTAARSDTFDGFTLEASQASPST